MLISKHHRLSFTPTRRAYDERSYSKTAKRDPLSKRIPLFKRTIQIGLGVSLATIALYTYQQTQSPRDGNKIFDPPRFTPFRIIGRTDISPTAFVLTLRPHSHLVRNSSTPLPPTDPQQHDPYTTSWETGTWSLEFKHPLLQIARSYTPLPPSASSPTDKNTQPGDLRFLIRREKGGEVSNYLANLPVGADVELRGPNPEIDIAGDVDEVLFLAGGTGIAPALQVAHTLLERRRVGGSGDQVEDQDREHKPRIRIVWANRRREDCVGGGGSRKGGERFNAKEPGNLIVNELSALQERHPGNLTIEYLVDEEGQFLDSKRVLSLTTPPKSQRARSGKLTPTPTTAAPDSKPLLFISGPEGFVTFLAGPKRWEGGKEGQGDVGGVIGRLGGSRYWRVWKL